MTDYTTFALKLDPGSDLQTVKKQMVGHISVENILMQEWGNFACKCTGNLQIVKHKAAGNSPESLWDREAIGFLFADLFE